MAEETCEVHIIRTRRVVSTTERDQGIGQVEIIDRCRGCDVERTIRISRAAHITRESSGVWMAAPADAFRTTHT